MSEKLSAFIDNELGELEERQVLQELERDKKLRATWERYHLIRAALRNELQGAAHADVSDAVAAAIAREPAYRRGRVLAMTLAKAAGGLAIAATVATVAILSVQSPVAPTNDIAAASKAPMDRAIVPVSGGTASVAERPPLAADGLNSYLLEHSEFAPTADMGNVLPYVRTVNNPDNNE